MRCVKNYTADQRIDTQNSVTQNVIVSFMVSIGIIPGYIIFKTIHKIKSREILIEIDHLVASVKV
jgi:hypothetical protein